MNGVTEAEKMGALARGGLGVPSQPSSGYALGPWMQFAAVAPGRGFPIEPQRAQQYFVPIVSQPLVPKEQSSSEFRFLADAKVRQLAALGKEQWRLENVELSPSFFRVSFAEWSQKKAMEQGVSIRIISRDPAVTETTTPGAEKYARLLGLYGSFLLAKQIVSDKMRSYITALYIDVREDPDEAGYATICFTITTRESVDHVLELDDALQTAFVESIPASDRPYLSLDYQFE